MHHNRNPVLTVCDRPSGSRGLLGFLQHASVHSRPSLAITTRIKPASWLQSSAFSCTPHHHSLLPNSHHPLLASH